MKAQTRRLWPALVLALFASGASAQRPPITVLETSIETRGDAVHLPGDAGGRLILENCTQCRDQALQLAPKARFFINGGEVSLAQLRTGAASSGGTSLTVHYRLADKLVTRIDLTVFSQ